MPRRTPKAPHEIFFFWGNLSAASITIRRQDGQRASSVGINTRFHIFLGGMQPPSHSIQVGPVGAHDVKSPVADVVQRETVLDP